jgi:hypothetical protein
VDAETRGIVEFCKGFSSGLRVPREKLVRNSRRYRWGLGDVLVEAAVEDVGTGVPVVKEVRRRVSVDRSKV